MITEHLKYPIARDVRAEILFSGAVTQEAIQKLIELLECEKDTYPSEKEMGDPAAIQDRPLESPDSGLLTDEDYSTSPS